MKTAVSIPDDLFRAAECAAADMGVTRSKFFALALTEYLQRIRDEEVTRRVNEVLAEEPAQLDDELRRYQYRHLRNSEW